MDLSNDNQALILEISCCLRPNFIMQNDMTTHVRLSTLCTYVYPYSIAVPLLCSGIDPFIPQRQNCAASSENEGICTPWTNSALSRDGLPLRILLDEYSLHQPGISRILQGICKLARSSRTSKQHSLSSKCPHNIQKVGNPISKHLYPSSPEACISQQASDNDSSHRFSSRAELKGRQLVSSKIPLFISWRLLILFLRKV